MLTLQLMLGIASVICLKAAGDSLFLSRFNARLLPYADLAVTALVGVIYYLTQRPERPVAGPFAADPGLPAPGLPRLTVVPGGAHALFNEIPDAFNRAMLQFLDTQPKHAMA